MATQISRLLKTSVSSTDSTVYQVASGNSVMVSQLIFCNTHSGAVTVSISHTGSGASSTTAADRLFHNFSIAAGETVMIEANLAFYENEKIWAVSSVNNVVNLFINGMTCLTAETDIRQLCDTRVPVTEAVVHQVGSGITANLTQVILCNTHSSSVTVDIAVTSSASTSTVVGDRIFSSLTIEAGQTSILMTNFILNAEEKIWADASVNNVVNILAYGYTYS